MRGPDGPELPIHAHPLLPQPPQSSTATRIAGKHRAVSRQRMRLQSAQTPASHPDIQTPDPVLLGCRSDPGSHARGTSDPTPSAEPVPSESPLPARRSGLRAKSTPDLEVQLAARTGSSRLREAVSPASSFPLLSGHGKVPPGSCMQLPCGVIHIVQPLGWMQAAVCYVLPSGVEPWSWTLRYPQGMYESQPICELQCGPRPGWDIKCSVSLVLPEPTQQLESWNLLGVWESPPKRPDGTI